MYHVFISHQEIVEAVDANEAMKLAKAAVFGGEEMPVLCTMHAYVMQDSVASQIPDDVDIIRRED
jgi:hypothetical protein